VGNGVLGPIFESGMVRSDRYLSVERCIGTDIMMWSGGFGPIIKCGTLCWEGFLCVER